MDGGQQGLRRVRTARPLVFQQRASVRNLGLAQQLETRLWQDKRLVADQILVEVEQEGKAILRGLVPDLLHKELAVSLAQDTRGVFLDPAANVVKA